MYNFNKTTNDKPKGKTVLSAHDKFTLKSISLVLRIIHATITKDKTITDKDMEVLDASSWLLRDLIDNAEADAPAENN